MSEVRLTVAEAPRLLIVSADSHAGPHPTEYKAWLDPRYRDGVDDLIRQCDEFQLIAHKTVHDEQTAEAADSARRIRDGGLDGLWDPARRLAEMDREGVAGEIIFPGDPATLGLYFSNLNRPASPEYRAAGCIAYNRWLADFCALAPERMVGIAQTEPWPDMQACVEQIRWAAAAGLGAIGLPRFPGIEPNQPPLSSRAWEPFWAACVDVALPVCVHVGHGYGQGEQWEGIRNAEMTRTGYSRRSPTIELQPGHHPFIELVASGVFDRHPELRATFTELRCEWVAPALARLERWAEELHCSADGRKLKLRPSDYWRRNCALGASSARPYEIALRHQIGIEQMMFGTDYPHPEGSWPNTREWIQIIFQGVPEEEARLILGENAARIYAMDVSKLRALADRIGPAPAEILGADTKPPEALVASFDWRAGFLHRPDVFDLPAAERVSAVAQAAYRAAS